MVAEPVVVATFYHFFPMTDEEIRSVRDWLIDQAETADVRGLVILANEGLNTTLSAPSEVLHPFITEMKQRLGLPEDLFVKTSDAPKQPFRVFKVKVRSEIVTTAAPEISPIRIDSDRKSHLSPEEWNQVLKSDEDVFLVDTRNWYETKIGTFRGAVDPKIDEFTEFPKFIEESEVPKDKKILMFCTGGIRCEKGILDLQERGYKNVYQLEGGILNYLKVFPNDEFEGECFVFDNRVAVTQELKPTERYRLCPHCGQPGEEKLTCVRCDTSAVICESCRQSEDKAVAETCSKNCAHHWRMRPGQKGPRQIPAYALANTAEMNGRIKGLRREKPVQNS